MRRAGFWIGVYLGVVLAPLVVLLLVPTPPSLGFWWDLALGLGFAGLVMMGVQFLLTARFRQATNPFGIDVIYYFHRYLAYLVVVVIVAHAATLLAWNPALLSVLNPFAASWEMAAGTISLMFLLTLVVSSVWRKRVGIPYDEWRITHLILAVGAVGSGFTHMLGVGYYSGVPAVRALWVLIGFSLVAVVLRVRIVRPWRLRGAPYRVEEVRSELGNAWTLKLAPDGHRGFTFDPGQFAWVTLRRSPFGLKEHPFSIASSPSQDRRIEFTIKELGDFTRTVGSIEPGEPAFVDGPYGAFSTVRDPDALGYVFIAGGIGIAPIASMLRALADGRDSRPHVLIAAHASWERLPLRDELHRLKERLDLRVIHVLEAPHSGWQGEVGLITRELLDRVLPDAAVRSDFGYFICGPVPMNHAVRDFLRELGIPESKVHTEIFDLA
jgi:predicted ferric reductase